ncbi:MAG: CesT family type III secretion system chaperone [Verrucomicrobiales bacterium]|jgi:hypothetical protein|nr:CesT family type III secretion system chaperone [bacterium]MDF1756659.1 CesT family type III secretion system chaperone [Verrucomicrobiales bacterium]
MNQDYRDDWLTDLGGRAGLSALEFDQNGVCQLILESDLVLTFYKSDTTDKLVVFGQLPVTHLPAKTSKEMLKRNRSSAKVSSPVISLSPGEDAIEVHQILDQAELAQGGDIIEGLVAELNYWKKAALPDQPETIPDPFDPNINFV